MTGQLLTRGHDAARRAVERWIVAGAAPHALLLGGPPNVGKTTLAEDLAAGLLCLAPDPADRPCRACLACRKIARGSHPDVHRLTPDGPGGQIRIAAARRLGGALALLPAEGRQQVAIVESAQRLNEDAQNALLHVLEEPPAGVTIVLCADDEEGLLPTVRSRCVRLQLPAVRTSAIAALLADRASVDPARAVRIARLAAGRPGFALAIAEQPEYEIALGRAARRLLDLTAADRRERLAASAELLAEGALLAGVEAGERQYGEEQLPGAVGLAPAERRRSLGALLQLWASVARDVALAGLSRRARVRHVDLIEELDRTAAGVPRAAIERFLERLDRVRALVEASANPELALDVLLLSWPRRSE